MRMIFCQRLHKQLFLLWPKCALAIFCLSLSFTVHAQTNVQGRVIDEAGKPVQSASVTIKGTTRGTTTSENGSFTISATPKDVLVISFVGFANKEIKVGDQTNITVSLSPVSSQFEEVIVIGYGTQKHTSVTGAISTVNSKTLNEIPVVSVQQAFFF